MLHISSKLPLKIFFWSLSIGEVSLDLVFEDSNDKKRANFLLQFSFQAAADSFIFNFLLKITDGGTIYSEPSMINGSFPKARFHFQKTFQKKLPFSKCCSFFERCFHFQNVVLFRKKFLFSKCGCFRKVFSFSKLTQCFILHESYL